MIDRVLALFGVMNFIVSVVIDMSMKTMWNRYFLNFMLYGKEACILGVPEPMFFRGCEIALLIWDVFIAMLFIVESVEDYR